jgi:DNA-binding transcriptional ArsR family regulator
VTLQLVILDAVTSQPPHEEISDAAALRLLAHPMRQRIERVLRGGPVNSTTLARALGQSTALTSYHLRQMARYGFIEEVPELAKGRERWWRAVPRDLRFPPYSRQDQQARAAVGEVLHLDLAYDLEKLAIFEGMRDSLGEWGDGLVFSRSAARLTLEELKQFFEEYLELLYRYVRPDDDRRPGARTVRIRLMAFPELDEPSEGGAR